MTTLNPSPRGHYPEVTKEQIHYIGIRHRAGDPLESLCDWVNATLLDQIEDLEDKAYQKGWDDAKTEAQAIQAEYSKWVHQPKVTTLPKSPADLGVADNVSVIYEWKDGSQVFALASKFEEMVGQTRSSLLRWCIPGQPWVEGQAVSTWTPGSVEKCDGKGLLVLQRNKYEVLMYFCASGEEIAKSFNLRGITHFMIIPSPLEEETP